MPLLIQMKAVELIEAASGVRSGFQTPGWLLRPGRRDCASRWEQVSTIYHALTGLELPEDMPVRERRRIDAVLVDDAGNRLVEIDESQHFNRYRRLTLAHYPEDALVAFDRELWMARSDREPLPRFGKWASARLPLFPGDGGRHRQRAFRDALADLLPPLYGFLPTLRIADFEVKTCLTTADPVVAMRELLGTKGVPMS